MICEDGVSVIYIFDGEFVEVNQVEKVLVNLCDGVIKLG